MSRPAAASQPSLCPVKWVTGTPCPSCQVAGTQVPGISRRALAVRGLVRTVFWFAVAVFAVVVMAPHLLAGDGLWFLVLCCAVGFMAGTLRRAGNPR